MSAKKPNLGESLKAIRARQNLNLTQLSERANLPQSTLSKVESGQMSLNYDKLIRVAEALGVQVGELFQSAEEIENQSGALARRTIDRADAESNKSVDHYDYRYLCNDLKNRLMIPLLFEVHEVAGSQSDGNDDPMKMMNVVGERFAYVLQGPVEFHCDHYETVTLNTGDSIYVDAAMPHAFAAQKGMEARVLTILSSSNAEYLKLAQETAMAGGTDATDQYKELASER